MNEILTYILVADAIQAFLLYLITKYDRSIEDHCNHIGVDINSVVIVAIVFGFIILPISFVKGVSMALRNMKNGK